MPKNSKGKSTPKNYTGKGSEGSLQQIILNACYQLLIETKKFPSKRKVYTEVAKKTSMKFKAIPDHIHTLTEFGVLNWDEKKDKIMPIFGSDLIKLFFDKKIGTIPITKEDGSEFTAYDLYTMTSTSKPSQWESIKQAWFDKVAQAVDADKKFPRHYFFVIFLILRIDQPNVKGFKKDYLDKFLSDNKINDFFKKHTNFFNSDNAMRKHGFIYIAKSHYQLQLGEKLEEAILRDALKLVPASGEIFFKNYTEAKNLRMAVNSSLSLYDQDEESEEMQESSDEKPQNLKRKFIKDDDTDTNTETESDDSSDDNKYKSPKTSDSMNVNPSPAVPVSREVSNLRNPFEFFGNKTSIPNSFTTLLDGNFCTKNTIELNKINQQK